MRRFGPFARAGLLPLAVAGGLLAACSQEPEDAPKKNETELPKELAGQLANKKGPPVTTEIGTPMAERVATIGVLNKRNNLTQNLQLKPGEAKRIGNVVVKLAACERSAPWEKPPETGAFVQVIIQQRANAEEPLRWQQVFSGWLFKNSPSLNVVEHPIYDVWVKDCAMKFPGEEEDPAAAASSASKPAGSPAATPSAAASPKPSPAPSAAPAARPPAPVTAED